MQGGCIYQQSKYYQEAKLIASDVVKPIGSERKQYVSVRATSDRHGKYLYYVVKFIMEGSHYKAIATKFHSIRDCEKFLKLSPSTQRKNYCLNGTNLDFISRTDPAILSDMKKCFGPDFKDTGKLFPSLELLSALSHMRENMFNLKNQAISTFMVYYEGSNEKFYKYFQKFLGEQLLEYDHEILINSPQLERPQLRKIDISKKENIEEYINDIMHIGSFRDKFFDGLHFYFCHELPPMSGKLNVLDEEMELWNYLHFNIAVAMGTLAEGHSAFIKIGGSFRLRTIQYIFLMKLAFCKVYFYKWMGSNCFSNEKFLVGEGFNKQNGRFISRYLLDNFEQIISQEQKTLMVDFRTLFTNDFHSNITDYNNQSPLIKYSKDYTKYVENADNKVEFYPHQHKVLQKTESLFFQFENLEEIRADIISIVPQGEIKAMSDLPPTIVEKKAEDVNIEEMAELFNSTKPKPRDRARNLFDLDEKFKISVDLSRMVRPITEEDAVVQMRRQKKQAKKAKAEREEK